jgi:hypothetical protein
VSRLCEKILLVGGDIDRRIGDECAAGAVAGDMEVPRHILPEQQYARRVYPVAHRQRAAGVVARLRETQGRVRIIGNVRQVELIRHPEAGNLPIKMNSVVELELAAALVQAKDIARADVRQEAKNRRSRRPSSHNPLQNLLDL